MNYLTNVKNVIKLSQQELQNTSKTSWHDQYKDSAWIFIGGLPFDLTEGDIICVFSQYGEVVNINLIRAKDTGKSKGFCFLCYEDQRSTILAVDNLNGIKILNRTIRVDHVQDYKVPKDDKKTTEETKKLYTEGCAPKPAAPIVPNQELPDLQLRETLADQIDGDIKLPQRLPIYTNIKGETISDTETEVVIKKEKKKKSKKKSRDESDLSSDSEAKVKVKKRCSSKDRDRHRDKNKEKKRDEESSKKNKDKYGDRSDRSPSRDRDQKTYTYKKDVSPNIPKRWR